MVGAPLPVCGSSQASLSKKGVPSLYSRAAVHEVLMVQTVDLSFKPPLSLHIQRNKSYKSLLPAFDRCASVIAPEFAHSLRCRNGGYGTCRLTELVRCSNDTCTLVKPPGQARSFFWHVSPELSPQLPKHVLKEYGQRDHGIAYLSA